MSLALELSWELRQPKDAPYCWPSHHFYPCGCKQDDWDYDDEDSDDWCCEQCNPREFTRRERSERDNARRLTAADGADEAFKARTRWLQHYGWVAPPKSTMENFTAILREFYLPAIKDQLNKPPSFFSESLHAEHVALHGNVNVIADLGNGLPRMLVDEKNAAIADGIYEGQPGPHGSTWAIGRWWPPLKGHLRKMGRVVS